MTDKKNNLWHYLFRKQGFGRTYWIEFAVIFATFCLLLALGFGAWHQGPAVQWMAYFFAVLLAIWMYFGTKENWNRDKPGK